MSKSFEGRTAIVTGAIRGIGLSIAERLVADGAHVVITARKQDALDKAVAHLGGTVVNVSALSSVRTAPTISERAGFFSGQVLYVAGGPKA